MKNERKNMVFSLRASGLSFREISRQTNTSKSTISLWLKGSSVSEEVKKNNVARSKSEARERILNLNRKRSKELNVFYGKQKQEAILSFEKYSKEPMFIAGLMLYAGEGDKSLNNHLVRISNVEPRILSIFINFLRIYCFVDNKNIKFWTLLYPEINEEISKKFWLEKLGLKEDNLYKSQVIKGKSVKKLPYGTGNIILGRKSLKVKILTWIDILLDQLSKRA